MTPRKTVRFLTEETLEERGIRAAAPTVLQQIVEIDSELLRRNIDGLLQNISDVLATVDLERNAFCIDTVRLALHVNAAGEVSVISLAKGSVGGQVCLEVTLAPRSRRS